MIEIKKKSPKLFNQIKKVDVFSALNKNYEEVTYHWFSLQLEWLRHSYKIFQDSEKYLILIYLFHQTLETYSKYLIKLNVKDYLYLFQEQHLKISFTYIIIIFV